MAKRTLNGDEQLSDAWLLDIFAGLPDSDSLIDEALIDVGDDLDAPSEPQPLPEPSEPHSDREGGCDGYSHLAMQSPMTASSAPPNDYAANKEIDASELIAQELSQMTIGERQAIFEDVNGLTPLNEETPMFLAAKLDDLQVELSLIKEKPAYNTAMEQNSTFVEDDTLRLKFLRCVDYNPLIAAKRFVKFFQLKLELFGLVLLTEEITMYDLSADAQAILASGGIQKLPIRDSAGRTLIAAIKFDGQIYSADAVPQFFFYFSMLLLEDEATQMSGAVGVHVRHNCSIPFVTRKPTSRYQAAQIMSTVPLKFQAFHFLAENNLLLRQLANIMQLTFSKDVRHRYRTHFGNFRKCKDELTSYGIPVSMFPLTDSGEIRMEAHLKWLEQRKKKEAVIVDRRRKPVVEETTTVEQMSHLINALPTTISANFPECLPPPDKASTSKTISPNNKDVLLGRGRPCQEHAGNLSLKQVISDWYDKYNTVPRMAKMAVAQRVVHLIEERGGRFLKKVDGVWYEVELSEARNKVAHGFRKKREMDAANLPFTPTKKASSAAVMMDGPKRIKVLDDD